MAPPGAGKPATGRRLRRRGMLPSEAQIAITSTVAAMSRSFGIVSRQCASRQERAGLAVLRSGEADPRRENHPAQLFHGKAGTNEGCRPIDGRSPGAATERIAGFSYPELKFDWKSRGWSGGGRIASRTSASSRVPAAQLHRVCSLSRRRSAAGHFHINERSTPERGAAIPARP